jgi:hypothetical protein
MKDYEILSHSEGKFVTVQVWSPVTMKIAVSFTKQLTSVGKRLGVSQCVIDLRKSMSLSSLVEKYEFAYHEAKKAGLTHNWQVALLIDGENTELHFLETVMQNAGYNFQLFEKENVIIEWLGLISKSPSCKDDAGFADIPAT